jgi:SHS2 domain-containing protein
LIFYKDAELLLFNVFHFDIIEQKGDSWYLSADACGEEIDLQSHELLADVKAVTLYKFAVEKTLEGWHASVILDV